jgi:long-chain acyl-CoA synthetase
MKSNQAVQEKRNSVDGQNRTAGSSSDHGADNLPVSQYQAATLNELLDISCRKYADLKALGMALEQPLTYRELHDRVLLLAAYLRSCGVQFGNRVAILAENSHNWGTVYLAVVRLGAVCVPILPDLPEADVHHILGEMECNILFLTQRQIEKVYDLERKIDRVVTLDDYRDASGIIGVTTFSTFLTEARQAHGAELEAGTLEFPDVEGDQLASILYTSGRTRFL